MLMFLHVGRVHEQVEIHASEHLVDMRVVVGDIVFFRPPRCPLRNNVTSAHDFGIWALRQMRQINARNAAATDDADSNPLLRRLGRGGWRAG